MTKRLLIHALEVAWKTLCLCSVAALLAWVFCGCARFGTTQHDYRYDPDTGKLTGKITTRASAYTLFSSRSDLARWKASQSEKTQGAEVGSLSQQGATNTANTIREFTELVKAIRGMP